MKKINGSLQNYAWGSHYLLAELRGEKFPTVKPEAELWFGANALKPSTIDGIPLTTIISNDTERQLGRGQKDLPFLVKLLAAGEPLSIQVHPTKKQAERGFVQDNRRGISLTSTTRNYRDDNHKPEILIALDRFQALAGFRPLKKTADLFEAFSAPIIDRYLPMIKTEDESKGLCSIINSWFSMPEAERVAFINELMASVSIYKKKSNAKPWIVEVGNVISTLNEKYPYDVGVIIALLLNFVELKAGEAIFVDARQLHCYLGGLGVEVQANSDNVLRGGLTSKHVDVQELLKILSFSPLVNPIVKADSEGVYAAPINEFSVRIIRDKDEMLVGGKPYIVLCTKGTVTSGDGTLLTPGNAGWIAAADRKTMLKVEGDAIICC